jgi:hypothetical protein
MHQQFNTQTETSEGHTCLRPVRPAPITSFQLPHTAGRSGLVLMHMRSSARGAGRVENVSETRTISAVGWVVIHTPCGDNRTRVV